MSLIEADIQQLIDQIPPLDGEAMEKARQRQLQLTKPTGSLGRLEELAIQLAGITRSERPSIARKAVIVMAGDHGVTTEGVSAYPSAVTPQMVENFLTGGAAINALAHYLQARVVVVDIAVNAELHHPRLVERKVAHGTRNMAQEAAMTREQMHQAILVGAEVLTEQVAEGLDLLAIGEMGIGNTTAASALTAALLHLPAAEVTGRGTGIDDQQLLHKITIIERALTVNQPKADDPLDALMKVGGLEIAGLVGVILAAAAHRVPIVVDGFISGAAALVATTLAPAVRNYLIAGHVSVERGHRLQLQALQQEPLLTLNLRLGEGTGAVMAMSIIESALHTHNEMATFAEAGVSERTDA